MNKLTQKAVLEGLNPEEIECYLLETVDSTNTFAKKNELKKLFLIVLAEEQTAGRGRQGKNWYSPDSGNIYMSIKFHDRKSSPPLSLLIGLLISEAMDEVSGQKINARLKWPNDILLAKKKICGILIESEIINHQVEHTIGIGINYSLPQKESWWGDLGELENVLPREELINSILKKIILYSKNGYESWKAAWEARCMHQDAEINILTNQTNKTAGIFRGIDDQGKMLLETANGIETIGSGECSIKGLY